MRGNKQDGHMETPQATWRAPAPPSALQGCFLGEAGGTPWECREHPFTWDSLCPTALPPLHDLLIAALHWPLPLRQGLCPHLWARAQPG